jgi:transposase InsO family protein
LGSDNGGEYNSNEFNDIRREARIKREVAIPYNPQQNGVAERNNRSIVKATKSIIHDHNLPMHLWVEASDTTVYVHNISHHKILGKKTP